MPLGMTAQRIEALTSTSQVSSEVSLNCARSPLLRMVVAGRIHYSLPGYGQTNIAISVLCGLICRRTEYLRTYAAEPSLAAAVASDS